MSELKLDDFGPHDGEPYLGYPKLAWEKSSLAVVVHGVNHAGCLLYHCGPHIAMMLEDCGGALEDIGLDDAPEEKISIWEGKTGGGGGYDSFNGDYHDVYLTGTFRDPTSEEWDAIRAGRCPWNESDWGWSDEQITPGESP